MLERVITVILPSGEQIEYLPTHVPVSVEAGEILKNVWEKEDGSLFAVVINMDQVAIIEETMPKQDQDEETLRLIEEAKARDAK